MAGTVLPSFASITIGASAAGGRVIEVSVGVIRTAESVNTELKIIGFPYMLLFKVNVPRQIVFESVSPERRSAGEFTVRFLSHALHRWLVSGSEQMSGLDP